MRGAPAGDGGGEGVQWPHQLHNASPQLELSAIYLIYGPVPDLFRNSWSTSVLKSSVTGSGGSVISNPRKLPGGESVQ